MRYKIFNVFSILPKAKIFVVKIPMLGK